jgi:hypothetical protein
MGGPQTAPYIDAKSQTRVQGTDMEKQGLQKGGLPHIINPGNEIDQFQGFDFKLLKAPEILNREIFIRQVAGCVIPFIRLWSFP